MVSKSSLVLFPWLCLGALTAQSPVLGKPAVLGTPIRTLAGMTTALDLSPDGGALLAMSMAGDVRIYDTKTGKRSQAFDVGGMCDGATWCGPKSERFAVSDKDGTRLFDAKTGKVITKLSGLLRAEASPDGAALVTATAKGEVVFVDAMTGAKSPALAVCDTPSQFRFSSDGKRVLVEQALAGTAHVVERTPPKVVGKVAHGSMSGGFTFLPDGAHVIGLAKRKVRKLAVADGSVAGEWPAIPGSSVFVPIGDGAEGLLADSDGGITHVDVASGEAKHEFREHRAAVTRMVVVPGGKLLISSGWDGVVRFWDLEGGKQLLTSPDHDNAVTSVSVSPDGKSIASGSWDNSTILWGADGKAKARVREHAYMVTAVHAAADGSWWSASQDGSIRHWLADGKPAGSVQMEGKGLFALALAFAGGSLVVAASDGTVRWFDAATGAPGKVWQGHGSAAVGLAADAAGTFVASVEQEGALFVWNVASGEVAHQAKVHAKGAAALCLAGDGVVVASGEKGTLVRFDGKAGKETHRITFGGDKSPRSVACLAAGKDFVVGGVENELCLFAAADLKALGEVEAPGAITSVAVSADGGSVVAGLDDGSVAVWKVGAPATPAAPAKPKK